MSMALIMLITSITALTLSCRIDNSLFISSVLDTSSGNRVSAPLYPGIGQEELRGTLIKNDFETSQSYTSNQVNRTMASITIIGGGVAGCSVATFLSRRGHEVTVVEANEIGGMLREIEFENGLHCDSAPHILFFDAADSPTEKLFSEYATLHEIDPYAKTYPRGELSDPHDYPVTRANAERWDDAETVYEQLDDESPASGETFDEFVKDQVGRRMYERYFESYTKKQWGVPPTEISGDWFDYKIDFPETEQPFFGEDGGYYPDRKYKTILEEMVSDCTVVDHRATGLVEKGNEIQAVESASGTRINGDVFVSTIDPTYLVDAETDVKYRSMVIVAVRASLDADLFPAGVCWGYFPNDYAFTRVTDYEFTPTEFHEETVLTFEFPCFLNDDIWTAEREAFEQRVEMFFERQGIDGTINEVVLRRLPRAYPLPVEEEVARFNRVNDELSSYDNLYNLGRVSTYQYIWIKDIVNDAFDTVDEIDATVGDSPRDR